MSAILLSSDRYNYLKEQILQQNKSFVGAEIYTETFPDGEHYWQIKNTDKIKGNPAVYICGTIDDTAIFEAYNVASALVREQCSSLHLVVPYFGYSTMERAAKEGEVVTAKNIAALLSSLPPSPLGNFVYMLDLHSSGIPYYFEHTIHPVHLTSWPVIKKMILSCAENPVLASADMGRAKWVEKMGNELGLDTAYIMKKRLSGAETKVLALNADVKGRDVVIFDDLVRSGSSLIKAAEAYKAAGANDVYAVTVHGAFVKGALEKMEQSGLIKSVKCTNSHPNMQNINSKLLTIYDVSAELANGLLL
jgi:ribose-phosphate pyrophosphokinase